MSALEDNPLATPPPREHLEALLLRGYRFALSLTHDDTRAEDLVQEACLRVSRNGGPWGRAYVFTVIRNLHIDQFRRARKVAFQPLGDHDPIGAAPAPPGFDDDLQGALGQLSDEHRELLYLSAVEGYTARELAELTQRPRGTVLSLLPRAKQKLRAILDGTDARNVT